MNLSLTGKPLGGSAPSAPAMHELGRGRRVAILLICCMSLLIVGIDITAVNVALPSIGRDLHASISGLQWSVDAYTLVLASFLMLSGSMGDRLGRKRVFLTGLTIFLIASLLCSIASSVGMLVAFRALQAIGGSMLNPVAMSIITNTFTDPRERSQAVGVWGAGVGISMALGPIVGGALVSGISWRAIFLLNVPIGIAAILLTARFIPESRAPKARRFDPFGQLLMIAFIASLTFAIIELPRHGIGSPMILSTFALALASLVGIIVVEPRRREPLLDLRFFKSAPFAGSIVIVTLAFAAFGAFLFLNTLYLQDARGFSAIHAGLETLPLAVVTMFVSPLSGRIVGRRGPRAPLVCSGIAYLVACLMLSDLGLHTSMPLLFGAYVIFGFGFGAVNAPVTNAAVSGMPRAQAGVAAATASTSRQFGQTLGVAIAGAIVSSSAGGTHAGFTAATHLAWWLMAGCGIAVIALGIAATGERARESARRTAVELNPEALG
jgi:EmrB/QacA subfamily drug resistance transporter